MDLQKAIKYIRACQRTHTDTVDWYDEGNSFQSWLAEQSVSDLEETFGDRKFHAQCVKDYGKVIDFLESVKERYGVE